MESPLLLVGGGEAGSVEGGWYGMRGLFQPYRKGKRLGVGFVLANRAAAPLTLLDASQPEQERPLMRLIGVRFALVPPEDPASSGMLNPMIETSYGPAEPEPVEIPPRREVFVQFNFELCGSDVFVASSPHRYNESATFRYVLEGREAETTVALHGLSVTVTDPAKWSADESAGPPPWAPETL
jgi:hypothetical protein